MQVRAAEPTRRRSRGTCRPGSGRWSCTYRHGSTGTGAGPRMEPHWRRHSSTVEKRLPFPLQPVEGGGFFKMLGVGF